MHIYLEATTNFVKDLQHTQSRLILPANIGSRSKQMRCDDEIECIETRRRSSRIVALEEKRQQEIEREIALALERKNKPINHDIGNKGKGKATMEISEDSSDLNKDEEGPIWQGCKNNKELHQLLSSIESIQDLVRHSQNASTPETNDSSQDGIPLKKILEIIIDFLQRKDLDELFAEPVNPDVEENYFKIVKQPMDFGTMRAKLHEGMYTNLCQFKRDIMLICINAMTVHRTTSKCHQVAKDMSRNATEIFEALKANFGDFQLEFSLNKKPSGRKPQNGNHKSSKGAAPKPTGRKNASTRSVEPKKDKRDMYCPPHKSLVSEILNANKPNAQLNKDPMEYKESLLRFVEDLGPTAQRVAGKKLEPLKDQPLENMSSLRHIQENSDTRKWNTSSSTPNTLAIGSSSNAFARVYPTHVISGPPTMLSLMPQPRLEDTMRNINNFPPLSLESHSRPINSVSCMPRNNFTELSLMRQPLQSLSMFEMPRNNPIELPLMHQPWKEPTPLQEPKPPSHVEEAPPQLFQDDDQQPNLDLRL